MQKKHESRLLLELKPSMRLKRFVIAIHLLALASSLANALPIAVKLALLTGICVHFCFTLRQLKNKQRKIRYSETLGWEISSDNDFKQVQIRDSTVITLFAIFLHLSDRQSVLIVNDALTEDSYRDLIVRLKTSKSHRLSR